jgi:hypothetical protein
VKETWNNISHKKEDNKSTKETWGALQGSSKMALSLMAIIILSFPEKPLLKCIVFPDKYHILVYNVLHKYNTNLNLHIN